MIKSGGSYDGMSTAMEPGVAISFTNYGSGSPGTISGGFQIISHDSVGPANARIQNGHYILPSYTQQELEDSNDLGEVLVVWGTTEGSFAYNNTTHRPVYRDNTSTFVDLATMNDVSSAEPGRISNLDSDCFVSVVDVEDRVNIQAGPNDGNIFLSPNTFTSSTAGVNIQNKDGVVQDALITTTQTMHLTADLGLTIQGLQYPDTDGTNGQILTTDGAGVLVFANASGVTEFSALTDTPADYVGHAGKVAAVNATEDGIEYLDMLDGGVY